MYYQTKLCSTNYTCGVICGGEKQNNTWIISLSLYPLKLITQLHMLHYWYEVPIYPISSNTQKTNKLVTNPFSSGEFRFQSCFEKCALRWWIIVWVFLLVHALGSAPRYDTVMSWLLSQYLRLPLHCANAMPQIIISENYHLNLLSSHSLHTLHIHTLQSSFRIWFRICHIPATKSR